MPHHRLETLSLPLNHQEPQIMHIDLNSAFATTEQQARPSLRGRPMGVTNRISRNCCVIAASYEAKARGVTVGMGLQQARLLIPEFIILETDPPKYHYMYKKLLGIMKSYAPNVKMKSIDEGVIDFHGTRVIINQRPLEAIGYEIKQRVKDELGDWMKVNVGIGPNRFWAKQAAGLHKPNGLDVIDYRNLRQTLAQLELTDLTGIARHFKARLNAANILTPLDFLDASAETLRRFVFHSVAGEDWYNRLRGYEVDSYETHLGTVGRQYVLDTRSADDRDLLPRFHYLCETTAKKLRYNQVDARGLIVWAQLQSGDSWYSRKMYKSTFYTDRDLYVRALELFNQRPKHMVVTTLGVTCYMLTPSTRNQVSLLEEINKQEWLTEAVDDLNSRYGQFVVSAAEALTGKKVVKQKIPFGSTKYFELLLKRA